MHFHYLTQGVTANSIGVNPMVPTLTNDMYEQTSTMTVPVIQGGYTSLLLGVFYLEFIKTQPCHHLLESCILMNSIR
jgi:hypothetical protein